MYALAGGFLNSEPLEKSYINFLWTHSWCRGKALEQDVGSNPDSLAVLWLGFILYFSSLICKMGFPGSWVGKESACSAEDLGSIPESGRSPGEGNGKPLQYSCLEKSHVQRSLVGYSPWNQSWTQLSNFTGSLVPYPFVCWWTPRLSIISLLL